MELLAFVLNVSSMAVFLSATSAAELGSTESASTSKTPDKFVSAGTVPSAESIPGSAPTPTPTPTQMHSSASLLNPVTPSGILSQSQGHQPGPVSRALGGVVSDAAHATMALVGTTILNQGIDLPPDDASSPEWPFREPHRKSMFIVDWADGSTAKISRLPDGSLQILGGGRLYTMQPTGEGSFALFGDYGSMATVTPRPGGGYTILKADGTAEQALPRAGGGFTLSGANGVIATILPGVAGKKHVIGGAGFSSRFVQ